MDKAHQDRIDNLLACDYFRYPVTTAMVLREEVRRLRAELVRVTSERDQAVGRCEGMAETMDRLRKHVQTYAEMKEGR